MHIGKNAQGEHMYRIAVVDDMPAQCKALADSLQEICDSPDDGYDADIQQFNAIADFEQALGALREHGETFDIVFMDILLSAPSADNAGEHAENGIDVTSRLFDSHPSEPTGDQDDFVLPTQVVYVTGHAEFCTKVYDTDHVSFLLKPVKTDELRNALRKAVDRCEEYRSSPICVHNGKMEYVVWPRHIQYMERANRTLYIHYDDGRVLRSYLKMRSLEPMMPSYLIRCHASYMVNLYSVTAFAGTDFVMCDGTRIPVSQRRKHKTELSFKRFARTVR